MKHPLALARKEAGLSQQALADEIACDRQTILRIEKGRQTPSMMLAAKIVAALQRRKVGLSADVFLPEASHDDRVSA